MIINRQIGFIVWTTSLLKHCIPLVSILLMLGSLSRDADAVSLKLHYEVGDDTKFSHVGDNGISYKQGGLDLFLYEGETLELFLGGEHAESSKTSSRCYLFCSESFESSYKYNAGVLGIRIKPVRNIRVKPYLMLGIVSGTVQYDANISSASYKVTSLSRDKASFTTYRTGLGLNINVIKTLSVEIEANYTGRVPDTTATVSNASTVVNTADVIVYDRKIFHEPIVGISFGVRYQFW